MTSFPDYGKLARINLDDLKAGARIDVDENKRSPYDCPLVHQEQVRESSAHLGFSVGTAIPVGTLSARP